jgi:tetratricopeptide (TPR) repeat protein
MYFTERSQKRAEAFETLVSAYAAYGQGRETEGRAGVEKALVLDPDLAYASIVRGMIALKEEDWPSAQTYFERGLRLLKQGNQPVSPSGAIKISPKEMDADTRCFLGLVYVNRAEEARRDGRDQEEQRLLGLASKSLKAGLALTPNTEARELAEGLLRRFR